MEEVTDLPADISTTGRVAVGGSFVGSIDFEEDVDWIAVSLLAGVEYVIDLEGSSTGAGTLLDPEIGGIRDSNGNFFGIFGDDDDGEGLNSRTFFSPEVSGTYYIPVESFLLDTGSYRLSVSLSFSGDAVSNTIATVASVQKNDTYSGIAEYSNDIDWIAVNLSAGNDYEVLVIGQGNFGETNLTAGNPRLRGLYNENGQQVLDFGNGNFVTQYITAYRFNAESSGRFYLSNIVTSSSVGTYQVVFLELQSGTSSGDFLRGAAGRDNINGADGPDQIFAGATDNGNDVFIGGGGADTLGGGPGNDLLIGDFVHEQDPQGLFSIDFSGQERGGDVLFGGEGHDTLIGSDFEVYSGRFSTTDLASNTAWGGPGDDIVYGASGPDNLGGGTGNDIIRGFGGNDVVYGGRESGLDAIFGGDGGDVIFAGGGSDTLEGEAGADELFGGGGDDSIDGGTGSDSLYGGAGDDTLTGGGDADTLFFAGDHGDDIVTDFSASQDILFLENAVTDFTDLASVQAASTETTQGGVSGLLIDTGGGNSIFLQNINLNDLTASNLNL